MIDAWAKAEQLNNKLLEGSGIYVRLANDGDKVVGVFTGDPYARQVHWTGSSYEECSGQECSHCETGLRAGLRVACNFYVLAERAMKIMEGGPRWFGDLLKVRKKYGLDSWAFEVERHGAAGSPKTTYTILPDTKLDEGQQALVAEATLHDLARDTAKAAQAAYAEDRVAVGVSTPAASVAVAGATLPMEAAQELHGQLKQLPRPDVEAFFQRFGVERVSQLQAADEAPARAFIAGRQDMPF